MEQQDSSNTRLNDKKKNKDDKEEATLPGFRFYPTDEELVGFYLRRKVEKKPPKMEFIMQVDIYKYDPWDLQDVSKVGEKEGYFFCMRGRKYKNSIRPNRATGSGFWKATGIDKPIYSSKYPHECIGLKKSLVYYHGSAGKGTKTDWMMHEFRLPPAGKGGTISFENDTITEEAGDRDEVDLVDASDELNRRFVRRIRAQEVQDALKKMKTSKALGPDGVPIEVWRCLGNVAISWLTKLFNKILQANKMPNEWRNSMIVPIYKNKGDIQNCSNYRGIKLMSHTMKL
ncbi:uncharacterized protein J3R85_005279 [Psidium guajava]|nr:uncharacterized protein J3R85_005279 [Psidium guajava]